MRFIGISGYPMKAFTYVLDRTDLDVVLSYNHYTLQNTMFGDLVPYLVDLTKGGADYSFECIGNVATMRQALETDGPVLVDVRVTAEENCFPMIPPGSAARDLVEAPGLRSVR